MKTAHIVNESGLDLTANLTRSRNATSGLHRLIRGPSVELSSSVGLGWENIAVARHRVEPGEKQETAVPCHLIKLASGKHLSNGERKARLI
ncbi:MAG: hypothetical protein JWQ49_1217 [Edaphobacter sp.]|nr:hypothetical protein [Edaphobacter sp.]